MDLGLDGKVVVITGAGSGIGLATARAFAGEGARLVAADREPAALKEIAASHPVTALTLDLADPAAPAQLIDQAMAEHGRIDVLVNNVGVAPYRDGFLTVSDEDWTALLNINFLCMVRSCRAVIPHMLEQGSGAIVSIASDAGRQPDPFFVDYAVSKASVLSLSKSLSMEYGPQIRVNCVSPGPTRTPALAGPGAFADSLAAELGVSREEAIEHFAKVMRKLPLGKIGEPEDVANVVLFLASSSAAAQVTGSDYTVNGGSIVAC
jgi:NAD(P)-dependent dehydrogenase (short-subunit alcohol dehydrogenase family)